MLAPDDGVISARTATVGSVVQPGQELFRLIRGGRLEWRAEVTATELGRITPGTPARRDRPGGGQGSLEGRVRMVAPTVDPQTRNAIVYVDLPRGDAAAGARRHVRARRVRSSAHGSALTVPQAAVVLRDGFSYVYRVGADNRVAQVKVQTGRRAGDRVEILGGLTPDARVVASGGGFLNDGDCACASAAAAPPAPRRRQAEPGR